MPIETFRTVREDDSVRVIHMRETSRPERSLIIDADDWAAFVAEVKAGRHDVDPPAPQEREVHPTHGMRLRPGRLVRVCAACFVREDWDGALQPCDAAADLLASDAARRS